MRLGLAPGSSLQGAWQGQAYSHRSHGPQALTAPQRPQCCDPTEECGCQRRNPSTRQGHSLRPESGEYRSRCTCSALVWELVTLGGRSGMSCPMEPGFRGSLEQAGE